jgi:APA family basic amino acid/polyamine antiporter
MARDGLFFQALAVVHPGFGTPALAIGLQALIASVLVVSGTFEDVLAYFIFRTVAFLALTVASVFVLGKARADESTSRVVGYPITPLVFLLPTALLLALLAIGNPLRTAVGMTMVVLGIPTYHLVFRGRQAGVDPRRTN